jgi:hypothetical protein
LEQYRQLTSLRRQDITFVTTAQAAILTIVGTKILDLDASGFLLSLIAVFVLFLGINSERRLSGYMSGYMRRAKEIESEYGMQLLSSSIQALKQKKLLISNAVIFPLYSVKHNLLKHNQIELERMTSSVKPFLFNQTQ